MLLKPNRAVTPILRKTLIADYKARRQIVLRIPIQSGRGFRFEAGQVFRNEAGH